MRIDAVLWFVLWAIINSSCCAQTPMVPNTAPMVPSTVLHGSGAMWSGIDTRVPQNWNFSDRMFVGNAANNVPATRSNTNTTWLSSSVAGAYWVPRDAQFISMATAGTIGVAGAARASDGDGLFGGESTIGVAGIGIGNSTGTTSARGGYFELQYLSGNYGYGIEIAAKNLAANIVPDPYRTPVGLSIGMQIGTGDPSYGGANANPTSVGIIFPAGAAPATYNQGLLFVSGSLTDGKAVSMPLGYQISWYSAAATLGAQMMAGAGSPAGVVSCSGRCLYMRTDGSVGSTLYVNETGGGTSGWAAK